MNALAFENPWQIVGAIGLVVVLRLLVAYARPVRKYRATLLEFVDAGLVAVLLVFCILRPFVIQAFYIPSSSMEATLQINDRILVNKFIYYFTEPRAGDVVVFDAPRQALIGQSGKKDFIKRVVGVPGDRIAVRNQQLYRNGVPMDEPYIKDPIMYEWPNGFDSVVLRPGEEAVPLVADGQITVPEGYLLVMGDNRNDSNDSHRWSAPDAGGEWRPAPFLPRENVLGKAFCIFLPVRRIGLIR